MCALGIPSRFRRQSYAIESVAVLGYVDETKRMNSLRLLDWQLW